MVVCVAYVENEKITNEEADWHWKPKSYNKKQKISVSFSDVLIQTCILIYT